MHTLNMPSVDLKDFYVSMSFLFLFDVPLIISTICRYLLYFDLQLVEAVMFVFRNIYVFVV